jgi:hypothetical protein
MGGFHSERAPLNPRGRLCNLFSDIDNIRRFFPSDKIDSFSRDRIKEIFRRTDAAMQQPAWRPSLPEQVFEILNDPALRELEEVRLNILVWVFTHFKGKGGTLTEVLRELHPHKDHPGIDPGRVRGHLAEFRSRLSEVDPRDLGLYLGACALYHKDRAAEILEPLLEWGKPFQKLFDAVPAPDPAPQESPPPPPRREGAPESVPAPSAQASVGLERSSPPTRRLTLRSRDLESLKAGFLEALERLRAEEFLCDVAFDTELQRLKDYRRERIDLLKRIASRIHRINERLSDIGRALGRAMKPMETPKGPLPKGEAAEEADLQEMLLGEIEDFLRQWKSYSERPPLGLPEGDGTITLEELRDVLATAVARLSEQQRIQQERRDRAGRLLSSFRDMPLIRSREEAARLQSADLEALFHSALDQGRDPAAGTLFRAWMDLAPDEAASSGSRLLDPVGHMNEKELGAILVLRWLEIDQLRLLALQPSPVGERMCLAAVRMGVEGRRPEILFELAKLPHESHGRKACDVVEAIIARCQRTGAVEPHDLLPDAVRNEPSTKTRRRKDLVRRELEGILQARVGMSGYHHKLRMAAKDLYVDRARRAFQEDDDSELARVLSELSDVDKATRQAIQKAGLSRAKLENAHLKSLMTFLERVAEKIRDYQPTPPPTGPQREDDPLKAAAARLLKSKESDRETWFEKKLADWLSRLPQMESHGLLLASASPFCRPGEDGRRLCEASGTDPSDFWTSRALAHGSEPQLQDRLADEILRLSKRTASIVTCAEAAMEANDLISAQHFLLALPQDEGNTIKARFEAAVGPRIAHYESKIAEILGEDLASLPPEATGLIEALNLVRENIRQFQFKDAEVDLELLREERELYVSRKEEKGRRASLLEWFPAEERPALNNMPFPRLEELQAERRVSQASCRGHIASMLRLAEDPRLPGALRASLRKAAEVVDTPSTWPKIPQRARDLEYALESILKFLARRLSRRDELNPAMQQILDRISETLESHLARVFQDAAGSAEGLTFLEELALECVEDDLQKVLGCLVRKDLCKPPAGPATGTATPVPPPGTSPPPPASEFIGTHSIRKIILDQARKQVEGLFRQHRGASGDEDRLRQAIHEGDWENIGAQAAFLAHETRKTGSETEYAAELDALVLLAHAAKRLGTAPASMGAWKDCLNALALVESSRDRLRVDLPERFLGDFLDDILRGLIDVSRGSMPRDIPEKLNPIRGDTGIRLLELLPDLPVDCPLVSWLRDALACAPTVLVEHLWEWPASGNRAAEGRRGLLLFLHRRQLWEALDRALGCIPDAEGFTRPLAQILRRRESDSSMALYRLLKRLELDAKSGRGLKPLRLFLESCLVVQRDEIPVRMQLGDLEQDAHRRWRATLHLEPNRNDPPTWIELELSEDCGLVFPDNTRRMRLPLVNTPLFQEQDLELEFVKRPDLAAGGVMRIPYRLYIQCLSGNAPEIPNEWSVRLGRDSLYVPPTAPEIQSAYPGANAKPVFEDNEGFVGRREELKYIESLLGDPRRPGSCIFVGRRRVGKTSLMLRSLKERSRRKGAGEVAIYMTLLNMNWLTSAPLTRVLWDRITSAARLHPENEGFRSLFKDDRSIEEMGRDLSAVNSLSDQINLYAERICEKTGNPGGRVYLFIDEFNALMDPYTKDKPEEVRILLAEIRDVVLHSRRVGLIMTTNPIARPLIDDPSQPLYGSVPAHPVNPFKGEGEQLDWCRSLLIPRHMREYLGMDENVLRYAVKVCGGVPYFLTLLGCSLSTQARRRTVTVPAINYAVSRAVRGDVPGQYAIDTQKFLQELEEIHHYPPRRSQLAELMLYVMARRVNLDFYHTSPGEVMEDPDLLPYGDKAELFQALNDVSKVELVERSADGLRFTTPIFAEALRLKAEIEIPTLQGNLMVGKTA